MCAQVAGCVEMGEEGEVAPTPAGRIASVYYLQHTTMAFFAQCLGPDMHLKVCLGLLSMGAITVQCCTGEQIGVKKAAAGLVCSIFAQGRDNTTNLGPPIVPTRTQFTDRFCWQHVNGDGRAVRRVRPKRAASAAHVRPQNFMLLTSAAGAQAVMGALCGASEYDELPVRHNEDQLNLGLSKVVYPSLKIWAVLFVEHDGLVCAAQSTSPEPVGRSACPPKTPAFAASSTNAQLLMEDSPPIK